MSVLNLVLVAQISFGDLQLGGPKEFVQENFIEHIQDHFVAYCSALAGITALKHLLRL